MNRKGLSKKHVERLRELERKHAADPKAEELVKLLDQETKKDERLARNEE